MSDQLVEKIGSLAHVDEPLKKYLISLNHLLIGILESIPALTSFY